MEIKEYLKIILKRWLLIFIITVSVTTITAGISYFIIKPIYKSDISVIIGIAKTETDNKTVEYSDVVMYQMLVKTYSQLAKSRTVSEDVIQSLKLDISPEVLQGMVFVTPESDTLFLNIAVKSSDAEQAMIIANQFAKSLKEVGMEINNMDNVQILDPAKLSTAPDSPKPMLNISIAFFLSLMVSISLAFLLEHLDNTVKTQEEVEKLLGVPVIGIIPFEEEVK